MIFWYCIRQFRFINFSIWDDTSLLPVIINQTDKHFTTKYLFSVSLYCRFHWNGMLTLLWYFQIGLASIKRKHYHSSAENISSKQIDNVYINLSFTYHQCLAMVHGSTPIFLMFVEVLLSNLVVDWSTLWSAHETTKSVRNALCLRL